MAKTLKKYWPVLIILLAFILRAYRISENILFTGEFGTESLYIRDFVLSGKFPLIGLATSHTWISYGPLYYWLMIPLVKIFGFQPIVGAWVGVLAGTLAVWLNYEFIKRILNKNIALISSFIIAISPLWIYYSRLAKIHLLTLLIWYPFVYFLWQLWRGKAKSIFWLGFFWGLFFNFHFSPLLILPVIIIVLILKRKILSFKHYLLILSGAILANLPTLYYDSQQGFSMLRNFILWVPYRIAGFLGLYPKNNLSSESFSGSLNIINEFFGKIFILDNRFWILATLAFFVLLFVYLKSNFKKVKSDFSVFLIVSFLASVLLGVFIHGAPPAHYFLVIFPIPAMVLAILIEKYKPRYWAMVILLLLTVNLSSSLRDPLFYKRQYGALLSPDFVPYSLQKEVASYIVNDARENNFSIKRVGPYDYFSENYSQSYRYLMWLMGNEPKEDSIITYTIYEDTKNLPKIFMQIEWVRNVAIIKEIGR